MNPTTESAITIIFCCAALVTVLMTISFVHAAVVAFQDWWND